MQNFLRLKEKIEKGQPIELSSSFTKAGVIISLVFVIVAATFMFPMLDGFQLNMIVAAMLLFALIAFTIYQLMFSVEAELKGKNLKMKKVIGGEYNIDISQVESVSTFKSKSTKYTTVKFRNEEGKLERVLILNSNSILFNKELTAGDVIKFAQSL